MRRLAALLLCLGCASDPVGDGVMVIDSDGGGGGGCVEGISTCSGQLYQVCQGGRFVDQTTCPDSEICQPGIGCVRCDPNAPTFCDDGAVFACLPDGSPGNRVEECENGACAGGACSNDCADGSELIYVVDVENTLLSFDPRTLEFARVGTLRCPAGPPWPEFSRGEATPFSMAVDRGGRAWVLYASGEIFWVDIRDASCRPSPFRRGEQGYELFGMSFVADAPGRPEETLYISGGPVDSLGFGTLARIDKDTIELTPVGRMPPGDFGAELTGNANAELYAYWPGQRSVVARIDKDRAREEQRWSLPALGNGPAGWAFAHWGGRYYVFISTQDGRGGIASSQVLRFDPESGQTEVVVPNVDWRIVGAGVSTCAPTVDNF